MRASIDQLHVDGNHDRMAVERDLRLFLPKLHPGSFVVADDASWDTIKPSADWLAREAELVFQLFDGPYAIADGIPNDFAIFRIGEVPAHQ